MVRNRIFLTIGEQTYLFYYPITSYRKIKVYRSETMDMGRSYWDNGVSGTMLLEKWCPWKMQSWEVLWYLLYNLRYFGKMPTMIRLYVESYVEQRLIPRNRFL